MRKFCIAFVAFLTLTGCMTTNTEITVYGNGNTVVAPPQTKTVTTDAAATVPLI